MNVRFPWCLCVVLCPCVAPAAGATQANGSSADCSGEACHSPDVVAMLQNLNAELTVATKRASCLPCEVRIPYDDFPDLELDIYVPDVSEAEVRLPVAIVSHGSGGDVKSMANLCLYIFVEIGFVCASIDPLNEEGNPHFYTTEAIKYLMDSAALYNADANTIILYGWSKGGQSVFEYIFASEEPTRNNVKGMIQDAASPIEKRYNWKKRDANGDFWMFPPLLMLHCDADTVVPDWNNVDKTIKRIKNSNELRGEEEQILYFYQHFTRETGCGHLSLSLNSWHGADAIVSFSEAIAKGSADLFEGIPAKIVEPGSATQSRRRRGEPNWP